MLCGYMNFFKTHGSSSLKKNHPSQFFQKPSRSGGFKERIAKELVIFMANCLIFFDKFENHGYIYRGQFLFKLLLFIFLGFFLRIVIMNPFKNLHDNCQGLFLFLIITQHPDPLSHLFIEESGLFVLFVCHIEISKIMVSPPSPLATLGTDGFNPQ